MCISLYILFYVYFFGSIKTEKNTFPSALVRLWKQWEESRRIRRVEVPISTKPLKLNDLYCIYELWVTPTKPQLHTTYKSIQIHTTPHSSPHHLESNGTVPFCNNLRFQQSNRLSFMRVKQSDRRTDCPPMSSTQLPESSEHVRTRPGQEVIIEYIGPATWGSGGRRGRRGMSGESRENETKNWRSLPWLTRGLFTPGSWRMFVWLFWQNRQDRNRPAEYKSLVPSCWSFRFFGWTHALS